MKECMKWENKQEELDEWDARDERNKWDTWDWRNERSEWRNSGEMR